ncbi:MAG TPA: carbohydrate-binding protein, partial [Cytophagaceae bacterium]|nr:carbohydrate-binding protein [Cytophagaceae bacterium]
MLLLCVQHKGSAQNWQLVWSDEFTNGISSDWVFETGAGGWGNAELEYYRAENATTSNGNLVITAKQESYGGANYTSVRMKTQGKKSWAHGKIEASISVPSFNGAWPAFWMLGDNISSVGWPKCGEIDIMEHVNTGNANYGTIHWADVNGNHVSYSNNTNVNGSITGFHTYTILWDANSIQWQVDGNTYATANIANGINNTAAFQNNFFILLNLAIGGNWPGDNIDNGAFPANMLVDYVRVYQDAGTTTSGGGGGSNSINTVIQAENYSNMAGVQTEPTTDAGGGLDVGYIDPGDWMTYNNITFPTSGNYTVSYRVASPSGGTLSSDLNAGSTQLGNVSIPATGGWQNWTTVTQNIYVNAGTYNFGVFAQTGGWNINWLEINAAHTPPTVSITAPGNNASYTAPASIALSASASAASGSNISKVSYYNGSTLLGTATSSPYNFTWSNVAAGTYNVTAVATDNTGAASAASGAV